MLFLFFVCARGKHGLILGLIKCLNHPLNRVSNERDYFCNSLRTASIYFSLVLSFLFSELSRSDMTIGLFARPVIIVLVVLFAVPEVLDGT